jgi:hypothetical protein
VIVEYLLSYLSKKRIFIKLKEKFYKTTISVVLNVRLLRSKHIHKMSVVEMKILRWINGNTRKYMI